MVAFVVCFAGLALGQPGAEETKSADAAWTSFYRDVAKEYVVIRKRDGKAMSLEERAIFDWASINDYNGAVFAWTEHGRPAMVATIYVSQFTSSPRSQEARWRLPVRTA